MAVMARTAVLAACLALALAEVPSGPEFDMPPPPMEYQNQRTAMPVNKKDEKSCGKEGCKAEAIKEPPDAWYTMQGGEYKPHPDYAALTKAPIEENAPGVEYKFLPPDMKCDKKKTLCPTPAPSPKVKAKKNVTLPLQPPAPTPTPSPKPKRVGIWDYEEDGARFLIFPERMEPILQDPPPVPASGNTVVLFELPDMLPFFAEIDPAYTGKVLKSIITDKTGIPATRLQLLLEKVEIKDDEAVSKHLPPGPYTDANLITVILSGQEFEMPADLEADPPKKTYYYKVKVLIPKYEPKEMYIDTSYTGEIVKLYMQDLFYLSADQITLRVGVAGPEITNSTLISSTALVDGGFIAVDLPDCYKGSDKLVPPVSFPVKVVITAYPSYKGPETLIMNLEDSFTIALMKQVLAEKINFGLDAKDQTRAGLLDIYKTDIDGKIAGEVLTDSQLVKKIPIEAHEVLKCKVLEYGRLSRGDKEAMRLAQWDVAIDPIDPGWPMIKAYAPVLPADEYKPKQHAHFAAEAAQ